MQIACEQCGAEYDVDERFLPAGGTAVQCTRCRHTFTARPPVRETPGPEPVGPFPESGQPEQAAPLEDGGSPSEPTAEAVVETAPMQRELPSLPLPPVPAPQQPMRPRMMPLALGGEDEEGEASSEADAEPIASARWIWVLLAVVLATAAWVGYGAWARRKAQVPAALQTQLLAARVQLRADAAPAVATAADQFQALGAALRTWREPRAWLALSRAFQLDDARAELRLVTESIGRLQRVIADLESDRESADAQSRANAARAELQVLSSRAPVLRQALADAETALAQVQEMLAPGKDASLEEQVALARVEMVLSGVRGVDPRGLVERCRGRGGGGGGDVIALAEYAANGGGLEGWKFVSPELKHLRETDASFIRGHVLAARGALLAGDRELANVALDAALALNAEHALARLLKDDLAARESAP